MTKLKSFRLNAGLSQEDLAYLSGVPLRSLQEYEQGRKTLGNASAYTVLKLSQALLCSMEDLLD